jgi:hypothetical protein
MSVALAPAAPGRATPEPDGVLAMLRAIEAFEDLDFDPERVALLWRAGRARVGRPLEAATPGFRAYATDELEGCRRGRFPAFRSRAAPALSTATIVRRRSSSR